MSVAADGVLAPALDRLYAAVAGLIDPVQQWHGGRLLVGPSLYEQLVDALGGSRGHGERRAVAAGSRSPLWVPAFDLRRDIDDTVRRWCPSGGSTPGRLRSLAATGYRPQDTAQVEDVAVVVESWAVSVKALLEPQRVKHFSVPCPACAATHVYRRDHGGDTVRQPALQIVAEQGCTCQACKATWMPQHYLLLCKVLGFDAPKGIADWERPQ
ncbi:hypothetical protein ABQE93_26780 [Mycolicibacterium sp. XJ662]